MSEPIALRFHHVGLVVPDLDKAATWYENMFGFRREREAKLPDIPADILFLQRGEMRLELLRVEQAHWAAGETLPRHPNTDLLTYGVKHIAFEVPDVSAIVRELQSRGAELVFQKSFPARSAAFFRDVAGNMVEIVDDKTNTSYRDDPPRQA